MIKNDRSSNIGYANKVEEESYLLFMKKDKSKGIKKRSSKIKKIRKRWSGSASD